jgi:hypothetical protein
VHDLHVRMFGVVVVSAEAVVELWAG